MFTFEDPTAPTEAQMKFAKKIRDVTGRPLPGDMTRQALHQYISANILEFTHKQRASRRKGPTDLDYDHYDDNPYAMWDEMEAYGLDPYTGGFAED